jgi:hypothetical protein
MSQSGRVAFKQRRGGAHASAYTNALLKEDDRQKTCNYDKKYITRYRRMSFRSGFVFDDSPCPVHSYITSEHCFYNIESA